MVISPSCTLISAFSGNNTSTREPNFIIPNRSPALASSPILRLATIFGFIFSAISFIIAIVYLILKLLFWNSFAAGTAPILIGLFIIGSLLKFFIGFLGEYILNINTRVMKRPLVVEDKRINFKKDESN